MGTCCPGTFTSIAVLPMVKHPPTQWFLAIIARHTPNESYRIFLDPMVLAHYREPRFVCLAHYPLSRGGSACAFVILGALLANLIADILPLPRRRLSKACCICVPLRGLAL